MKPDVLIAILLACLVFWTASLIVINYAYRTGEDMGVIPKVHLRQHMGL
jgi:hypothetical protein